GQAVEPDTRRGRPAAAAVPAARRVQPPGGGLRLDRGVAVRRAADRFRMGGPQGTMAPDRHRQDVCPFPDAAGVRAWQDRCLGRTPAQRDQRPAVRLRLRAPGLARPEPRGDAMAELFNACEYLLDRRLAAGDGDRLALTGPAGDLSYSDL